jgi:hypothetical protein
MGTGSPFEARKGKLSLGLATGALLALWLAVPVQAATDAVDQSETYPTYSYQTLRLKAETFTPAVSGRLDQVSLYAATPGFYPSSFLIQIWTVNAGQPAAVYQFDSTTSATTAESVALMVPMRWHDFPLSRPVPLSAGTQYAIVLTSTVGVLEWGFEDGETYPGGKLWVCCGQFGTWLTGSIFGVSFDFKTWMNTSTNSAPTLGASNAAVSVNEGTAPTNTGTYADTDGDTVALSASAGTVTTSGGASSGTWSWTQPAGDEVPAQNVTITADDGKGVTASTTFSVTVQAVAPAVHIGSGSPVLAAAATSGVGSSPEGTPVSLTASATSPAGADNAAGFGYAWAVTKNGNPFSAGSAASFSFTPDDEGTYVVSLQAKDDGGMSGAASLTLTGANVAPAARITGVTASAPLVLTAQEPVAFTGSFSDPGALDSHTATWNFGDGATATANYGPGGSAGLSTSHTYGAAGSYVVSLTVTDDDGGVGLTTLKVVVQTPQQAIASITAAVQGLASLNKGELNSLTVKLNAASDSLSRGNTTAANNQLNAFLNELQADVNSGKVTAATANTLRLAVHAVQAALGTYNKFLEWWPLEA